MMTNTEIIEIVQEAKNGKIIECRELNTDEDWIIVSNPIWNFFNYEYRVKPKERPYKCLEEFLEAMKEHGPYICLKNSNFFFLPVKTNTNEIAIIRANVLDWLNYKVLNDEFVWQDNTPCGIID